MASLRACIMRACSALAIVAFSSAAAACSSRIPDAIFACTDSKECPPGQRCYDGLCRRIAPDPSRDTPETMVPAAAVDAGPQEPASTLPQDGPSSGAAAGSAGSADGGGNGGDPSSGGRPACRCSTSDACCDGCVPKNEAGSCTDDGLECTTDLCQSGRCVHEQARGFCLVDGVCVADSRDNPNNACEYCNALRSAATWTVKEVGAGCDDGVFCNGVDTCDADAQCSRHRQPPCGQGDACETCDEATQRCNAASGMTWYDPSADLTWEVTPSSDATSWQPASDVCAALSLCGEDDWRLPTIVELRSIVRGCAPSEPPGSCGVNANCTTSSCATTACGGCMGSGPGAGGAFLPDELAGPGKLTFSSTGQSDNTSSAWCIEFATGSIVGCRKVSTGAIQMSPAGRCVRTGQ
jgi:hypothetical protein